MTDRDNAQSNEPMVADPERAGTTEQSGGSGTGSSNIVSGQNESGSSRPDSDASEAERSTR